MNQFAPVYLTMILLATGVTSPVIASPETENTQNAQNNLMYILLTAEMALDRNLPKFALKQFLLAADLSLDPKIAEEATSLAIQIQRPNEALIGAKLWANKAPNNLQAQLVAMTLLIGMSPDEAMSYLSRAFDIAPKDVEYQLIGIQLRLSDRSRKQLKVALDNLAKQRTTDAYAQLAAAESAAQLEDIQNATLWVNSALKLSPNLTKAIELKARLIRYQDENDTEALAYLSRKVKEFSLDGELRLFYASALIDAKQTKEAIQQLTQITEDKVVGGEALIFLGEIYLKENKLQNYFETLQQALQFKSSKDTAAFLLGQLSESQGKPKEAIQWYSDISEGIYQLPAYIRAASLLAANKEYDKAIQMLHNTEPTSWEEEKQLILIELNILIEGNQLDQATQLIDAILPKISDEDLQKTLMRLKSNIKSAQN